MKKNNLISGSILGVMIFGILLAACTTQTAVDPSTVSKEESVTSQYPESDNGKSWAFGSRVEYDTQTYKLYVEILGELSSNQTTNGSISGFSTSGYGSVSGRIWTEGKGILPVKVLTMSPTVEWIDILLPVLLKTSDLKVMGVPVGAMIDLICNHDVEVLSPVFTGQTLTTDRLTDELDNCRMLYPQYQ